MRVCDQMVQHLEQHPELHGHINIAEWARASQVEYQRLNDRWRGYHSSLHDREPTNSRLNSIQRTALVNYLVKRDEIGLPVPLADLPAIANAIILRSLPTDDRIDFDGVGARWAQRFMTKHGLKKIKRKPLELLPKEAHDPELIRGWFRRLEAIVTELDIKPQNLWNFDETGFRIGIGGAQWVITIDTRRRAWSPSETNRKHVTAVEAVNAVGDHIEAMLIAPGKVLQERWFPGLCDDTLVGVSESGYMNDELALAWIKHFKAMTRPSPHRPGQWRQPKLI